MLAATSMLIGATLTAVYYMSKHPQNLPILIVAGAFVGLCIYGMIDLLFLLFQHSLDLLPQRFLAIAEAAIYVIGGVVGWFIGLIHCQLVFPSTQLVPRISGDVRERSPRPSA